MCMYASLHCRAPKEKRESHIRPRVPNHLICTLDPTRSAINSVTSNSQLSSSLLQSFIYSASKKTRRMNTFSFLLSAILLTTSTKHGRFAASALSENGNLPVWGNASSPPMKTQAASSLDSLQRALANVGVNDTLSCADELRTLFTNRTRTEHDISIAPWSYLRAFRDSTVRLENLLFRLSSAESSSKNASFASFEFLLHLCASIFPVCVNGERISLSSLSRKIRSVVRSLEPFVNFSAVPVLSILSEASVDRKSALSSQQCSKEFENFLNGSSGLKYSGKQAQPPGGFCFNSECRSPLLSTSNKEHWDESVRQVLLSIHTTVNLVFPNSSLPFNESVLPCGRECMSIGYSKSQHRIAQALFTVLTAAIELVVLFPVIVFLFNLRNAAQQYVRRMLILFTSCVGITLAPQLFSTGGNRPLTCHSDGTLVTHAPRLSYACGYVGWHMHFFGSLSLGYGVFTSFGWQQLCAALRTPVAHGRRSSSMATWWSKYLMDVVSFALAFIPAAALSLSVVAQDGYEAAPVFGICRRSVSRGFSNYYDWYHVAAAATASFLLLRGVYILFQSFGVLGTWNWLNEKVNNKPFPLKNHTIDALKQFSKQMIFYLLLCIGSFFAYLQRAVKTEVEAGDLKDQELRHIRCILTSCHPDACPSLPAKSVATLHAGDAVTFVALLVLSTWAYRREYLANVPGIRSFIHHQKQTRGSQSTETTTATSGAL